MNKRLWNCWERIKQVLKLSRHKATNFVWLFYVVGLLFGLEKSFKQAFKNWGEVSHDFFYLAILLGQLFGVADVFQKGSNDFKVLGHNVAGSNFLNEHREHPEKRMFHPDIVRQSQCLLSNAKQKCLHGFLQLIFWNFRKSNFLRLQSDSDKCLFVIVSAMFKQLNLLFQVVEELFKEVRLKVLLCLLLCNLLNHCIFISLFWKIAVQNRINRLKLH